jgi:enoyl-CoA hydratase
VTENPDDLVRLDISGGVGTITLDSPHNRNALSQRLVAELLARLDDVRSNDQAKVVPNNR